MAIPQPFHAKILVRDAVPAGPISTGDLLIGSRFQSK